MVNNHVTLSPGVVVEKVGNEVLVKVPGSAGIIMLSGEAHAVIRSVEAEELVAGSDAVAELIRLGVLTESSGVSRRGLITAGALGAGMGIAVLAMPGVAAAASQHEAGEVAVTFVDRRMTIQDGARHVVRVAVRLPLGFVAPVADPVAVSARIGTDQVAAAFVTLFGNVRADWYDTSKPVHLLFWNISTALGGGGGFPNTDGEVVFTWGTTTFRATGAVTGAIGGGGLG